MSALDDGVVTATRVGVQQALNDRGVLAADSLIDLVLKTKEVTSDEQMQEIIDTAKVCKQAWKFIDDQRKTITAPLKKAMDAANDLARPKLDALKRVEDHAKSLYHAYDKKKKAEAERKRIEAEAEAARVMAEQKAAAEAGYTSEDDDDEPVPSAAVAPPDNTFRGGIAKVHTSTRKAIVIADLATAARAYPHLIEVKVRQADAQAELARLRREDPEAMLEGFAIEEKASVSLS